MNLTSLANCRSWLGSSTDTDNTLLSRLILMASQQILQHFIDHRHEVILRRTKYDLEEAEKRAKNRAHQAAVHREILAALALLNISEEAGKLIIAAIAKGAVPHVSLQY